MPRPYFYPQPNKGSIIIICLWIIVILSVLGMGLTSLVFQEIKTSATITRLYASLPLAQAAVRTVFFQRENDLTPGYDTMAELTRQNTATLCDNNSFQYYFTVQKQLKSSVEVIDEGALININTVSLEVLKRLPGLDEDMAFKIFNSELRPYTSINELLLIEDMTLDKFRAFNDMITVYGTGKVNINTASKKVLICLGLDEELADIILDFRKKHKIEPAKDDQGEPIVKEEECGFSGAGSIISDLSSFDTLSLRQEQDLISIQNSLDVKSAFLRVSIIPKINNKEGVRYSVVINPKTKKVMSWKEY